MSARDDDLFQPSIEPVDPGRTSGARPWRLSSLLYASFFGGPLAAAVLGYLNGRRLGDAARPEWSLLSALGLTLAAAAGTAVYIGPDGVSDLAVLERSSARSIVRLAARLGGVAVYLLLLYFQKPSDRLWQVNRAAHGESYASLWVPGLIGWFLGPVAFGMLVFLFAEGL